MACNVYKYVVPFHYTFTGRSKLTVFENDVKQFLIFSVFILVQNSKFLQRTLITKHAHI